MAPRQDVAPATLEIRALYTIAELARFARVRTYRLRRALRANGIVFVRSGRALFVPLSEIESKIPPLWQSLVAGERLRHEERCPKCQSRRLVRPGTAETRRPQG